MSMKKMLSIVLVLVLVGVLFAGCTPKEEPVTQANGNGGESEQTNTTQTETEQDTASDSEVKEITMFGFKTASEAEVIETLIEKFNAENADINLTYEGVANASGYQDVLNTRLASGQGDDLFFGNGTNILPLYEAGYVLALNDMEVVDNYASDISINGNVLGLPNEKSVFAMYTNQDLLDELGLEVPKTYEEFLSVCEKVQQAGKISVVAGSKDGTGAALFITAKGLYPVYKDADASTRLQALDKGEEKLGEVLRPGFEMVQELMDKEYIDPLEALVMNAGPDSVGQFASGEVAFMLTGNWMVKAVKEAAPELNFTLEGLPIGQEPVVLSNTGVFICVNANSKNQEAAKRFLEFMLTTENQNTYVQGQSAFTVLKDGTSTDIKEVAPVAQLLKEGKDAPWVNASFANYNPWALAKEYGANVLGGATVDEAVEELDQAIEIAIELK